MADVTPPGKDRRAAKRHEADALISFEPLAPSRKKSLAALIKDVSRRGMSLVLMHRFAPGTALRIDLTELTGGQPAPVVARVVHVARRDDGRWELGCALQTELTEQQIQVCRAKPDGESWPAVACALLPEENW